MLPSSSAGLGYCEINAFHLAQGQQPPNLQPQAHYTYDELETLLQVQTDVNQNFCVPSSIHSWAVWIEPMPLDGRDLPPGDNTPGSDNSPPDALADDGSHDLAVDAGSIPMTTTDDTSAAAGGRAPETTEADSGPGDADHVVPPHPNQALFDLALTRHQLPAPQHREFQEGLAQALAKATETYTLTGLSEEEGLNAARSAAGTFIRDMGPLDLQRAKRQKFVKSTEAGAEYSGTSSSSWY